MRTVETIEYYEECPACGASNDGSGVCSYCGSSLMKSRTVQQIDQPLEDVLSEEDRNLPLVKGKCATVNTFLKLFCPLFGGIFLVVPTFISGVFFASGMMALWLIPFFSLFWIIGVGGFAPLVRAFRRNKRCKNGAQMVALVRGYSNSSTSTNGTPTKNICLRIEQGGPYLVEFNTGETKRLYPVGSRVLVRTDGQNGYLIEGLAQ